MDLSRRHTQDEVRRACSGGHFGRDSWNDHVAKISIEFESIKLILAVHYL